MGENSERPILNIEGDLVALGPLRRELLPLYQRWINNLATMRTLGLAPLPMTSEKEQDWYDRQSKAEDDVPFTIYERETLRPIGNTGLHGVDHRNRSATFGILIGEPDCRGKGYGTETTRLMLDYAFTALGLHNVMLTVFAFNAAGTRFAPHPEVQRPASRHPPGRMEAAHEPRKPGRIEVLPLPMVTVVEADHNKH
jgi:RimJ/RimL family protein N-acetyltransferase